MVAMVAVAVVCIGLRSLRWFRTTYAGAGTGADARARARTGVGIRTVTRDPIGTGPGTRAGTGSGTRAGTGSAACSLYRPGGLGRTPPRSWLCRTTGDHLGTCPRGARRMRLADAATGPFAFDRDPAGGPLHPPGPTFGGDLFIILGHDPWPPYRPFVYCCVQDRVASLSTIRVQTLSKFFCSATISMRSWAFMTRSPVGISTFPFSRVTKTTFEFPGKL